MQNRVLLLGCPKLDGVDYGEKLTRIIRDNRIRSITVVRMTVPCCGGLTYAVERAVENSGKHPEISVIKIAPDGTVFS